MVTSTICILRFDIIISSSSGKDTPQYKAIRESFGAIVRCIEATSRAKQTIIRDFIEKSWIDANTDCSEHDIVKCALARVEQNAIQFQDFVSILRGTTGMDVVVIRLEEKEKYYKSLSTK